MPLMDVVVPCDCGSRFSFAVEPVESRLPTGAELLCPSCGKDGVPLANRVIGENLRKQAKEEAALQAAQPQKKSFLKKGKREEPKAEPAPYSYPTSDPYSEALAKNDGDVYSGPNRVKGIVGALLGGVVGAATWAGVVHFTGYEIKYVAVGVGALVGLGSRTLGGGRDYFLGLFATLCALMAILVGQYFAARIYLGGEGAKEVAMMEYEFKVESAKEAAELKTETDFKDFIAAQRSELFEPVDPSTITAAAVAEFKRTELPALQKLANGEPSKAVFIEQEAKAFMEKLTVRDVFIAGLSPYLFFWAFVGIGAAWKLASDYGTSVE
jgi:hypothetical protein